MTTFDWLKGHGTENDFVLLPDHDGSVHGRSLDSSFVAGLCHRRRGIGADGAIRVIACAALDDPRAHHAADQGVEWFMDYLNSDGSVSQMCGNGLRLFARHLADESLVRTHDPVPIGTRDGIKSAVFEPDGQITVDLGMGRLLGESPVSVGERQWNSRHVDMGNPHAVAFVADLGEPGPLLTSPGYDQSLYPEGVNIEFVQRVGERHVAMRVFERGSGETRSCGTGAGAVLMATAVADGAHPPVTYRVDVPGGALDLTWDTDGGCLLTGPAEIVARGTMTFPLTPLARP